MTRRVPQKKSETKKTEGKKETKKSEGKKETKDRKSVV